jgi:hypothetical protein
MQERSVVPPPHGINFVTVHSKEHEVVCFVTFSQLFILLGLAPSPSSTFFAVPSDMADIGNGEQRRWPGQTLFLEAQKQTGQNGAEFAIVEV